MLELKDIAVAKLYTRETLIREIQERVLAELKAQAQLGPKARLLNGSLGEQIAIAGGHWNLDVIAPQDVAEGICNWLDKYFLQSFGPREGSGASHSPRGAQTSSTPKGGDRDGDDSRVARPDITGGQAA